MSSIADLLARSPATRAGREAGPATARELDLRGHKLNALDNLECTQDSFDSIDLSDNEVARLEVATPQPLGRLTRLRLACNRISYIADGLGDALPHLEILDLMSNDLKSLRALAPLAMAPSIISLTLVDNPVTEQKGYRAFVIALLPKLRVLDHVSGRGHGRSKQVSVQADTGEISGNFG